MRTEGILKSEKSKFSAKCPLRTRGQQLPPLARLRWDKLKSKPPKILGEAITCEWGWFADSNNAND